MKQLISRNIVSRLLVLCLMIGGLIYVSTSSQSVLAAPCCQECDQQYNDCMAGCNGNSACQTACSQDNFRCLRHCVFC